MKSDKCPKCGAPMFQENGYKECRSCKNRVKNGNTSQTNLSSSSSSNNLNTQNYNQDQRTKKEIGFWDRLTGRGVEKLIDEYSEIYGEILLGMHRELTTQKKKLSDFENDIKELEKLNDIFGKDNNINKEGKYIIELAKRLAENIAKVNNDNLKAVNDTRCLIEEEFRKISQSITKNKDSITQFISENSKIINQKIQFVEEKLFIVNSSITKQILENNKNFSIVLEKSDTNKSLVTKSLNWNRAFIILTFITSLTILGILLWKTNLL